MIEWIRGRELLEPPYNLTKRKVYNAVRDGVLVPWESPDGDHNNRAWRVFPTRELQEDWLKIIGGRLDLEEKLERAKGNSLKTDEAIIEQDKFFRLEFMGEQNSEKEESEKVAKLFEKIPELRQRWAQEKNELPIHIKNLKILENEYAPKRIWKTLDLGPAQQEALMERLLDVWYLEADIELFLGTQSKKQLITEVKNHKLTVPPGTRWEDIKITLISNDTVRIKTPDSEKRFTYSELGLLDERTGDRPTRLWGLLKIFAQNQGVFSADNTDYDPKLPDATKALNKHLKEFFGINDSIFKGHYKKERGYKTKILFGDQTYADKGLNSNYGHPYKKVTAPDVKGLTKSKVAGTQPNTGKLIENRNEIAELFGATEKWRRE